MTHSKALKCRVVSLRSETNRRDLVTQNLNSRSDLDWAFYDAREPDDGLPSLPASPQRQATHFGRSLSNGELACYQSHYDVIKEHSTASGWMLIMEDDVWLDPDFDLDPVIEFAEQRKIHHIKLFAFNHKPARAIGTVQNRRKILRFLSEPYGAQAYLINAQGAKQLVDSVSEILRPIDAELGRFWDHGLWPLVVFPFPCLERTVPSSLEMDRFKEETVIRGSRLNTLFVRISDKLRKFLALRSAP